MRSLSIRAALVVALALVFQPVARAAQADTPTSPEQAQGLLGLVVAKDGPDAPLMIKEVLEGGPAEAAGLLADDQILAIDDIDVESLSLDQAVERLRGTIGTWVTLALQSGEDRFDLSVRRAASVWETQQP